MKTPTASYDLSFVGLGKLGLPLAACFGDAGIRTVAIDVDADKISALQSGLVPIEEPGLADLLSSARKAMTFTTKYDLIAGTNATIFLVPTPSDPHEPEFSDLALLAAIERAAGVVAAADKQDHIFVISSTVMPGALELRVRPMIEKTLGDRAFGLAYVPDFVALGDVIKGFKRPDFLLVGQSDSDVGNAVVDLYSAILSNQAPVEQVSLIDAEIAKVSLNTYLCLKISFANFLGQYCGTRSDADVDTITRIIGRDERIGSKYFSAGMAYGGACFPRDTHAFMAMARAAGLSAVQIESTEIVNERQRVLAVETIRKLEPQSVAILGIAFKPQTPATDASPGVDLARALIAAGIQVALFDFLEETRKAIQFDAANWCSTIEEAIEDCDCIAIAHPDKRFRSVLDILKPHQRVIDYWGILPTAPNVLRVGRPSANKERQRNRS